MTKAGLLLFPFCHAWRARMCLPIDRTLQLYISYHQIVSAGCKLVKVTKREKGAVVRVKLLSLVRSSGVALMCRNSPARFAQVPRSSEGTDVFQARGKELKCFRGPHTCLCEQCASGAKMQAPCSVLKCCGCWASDRVLNIGVQRNSASTLHTNSVLQQESYNGPLSRAALPGQPSRATFASAPFAIHRLWAMSSIERERERGNSTCPFSQHWLMRTCPCSSHLPN